MSGYTVTDLPPGKWVPNGKGTLTYVPDRLRLCWECGTDITFAEYSRLNRCENCRSTPGPKPKHREAA